MIEAAQPHSARNLTFEHGDASTWRPTPDVDVIVSNATLQWVPEHRTVLARWADALPPDGWLAIQVPGNFQAPSHAVMRTLAESPRWRPSLEGVLRHHDSVAEPSGYATLLMAAGLHTDVWETTYLHVLPGPDPVLEWVRGTGLRPILAALTASQAALFEAEYAQLLREAYPATEHGTVLPFRRIFAVGHRRAPTDVAHGAH
jgi:trans-aconitate 2-methyltransferase